MKTQDAEVTGLRRVVCPHISRIAEVPASPFPPGTYSQPQHCNVEKQTSEGNVSKPISQGAPGAPRKPRYKFKAFLLLQCPQMFNSKGGHRVQQHQGDNTQSNSTVTVGYTKGQSITEHWEAEISLQRVNSHVSYRLTEAPPEVEQALK